MHHAFHIAAHDRHIDEMELQASQLAQQLQILQLHVRAFASFLMCAEMSIWQ